MKVLKKDFYNVLITVAVVVTLVASVYVLFRERQYFSSRNLRQIGAEIRVYGIWSPMIIFSLVVLSTLIPPLPIPIPFLEISAGIILGFWPGVILIWISQITSALACYGLSRKIGKMFMTRISKSRLFDLYKKFIQKRPALAVFLLRATMSSPFNISYFVGLMQMNVWKFFVASALGIIPEVVGFVFLGTLINERVRFRLWYVFLFLLVLNYLPTLIFVTAKYFQKKTHD